ncbi:MAG: hypothetical protein ABJA57_13555 [Ginsengibacter sp.]
MLLSDEIKKTNVESLESSTKMIRIGMNGCETENSRKPVSQKEWLVTGLFSCVIV